MWDEFIIFAFVIAMAYVAYFWIADSEIKRARMKHKKHKDFKRKGAVKEIKNVKFKQK